MVGKYHGRVREAEVNNGTVSPLRLSLRFNWGHVISNSLLELGGVWILSNKLQRFARRGISMAWPEHGLDNGIEFLARRGFKYIWSEIGSHGTLLLLLCVRSYVRSWKLVDAIIRTRLKLFLVILLIEFTLTATTFWTFYFYSLLTAVVGCERDRDTLPLLYVYLRSPHPVE